MNPVLPAAANVRAVVVGIERYPGLGLPFDAPGTVQGALNFARWLVLDRGVPAGGVSLWLNPLIDAGLAQPVQQAELALRVQQAGLAGTALQAFNRSDFAAAMAKPSAALAGGSFLVVYFCGHGVVYGPTAQQYLVLPEATADQFQCIDTLNWRTLFKSAGWQRFGHQLWITDACRNQWGEAMKPLPALWQPGDAQPVRQCVMFSCATGETAAIDAQQGPRFTRSLIEQLAGAPLSNGWPDYEAALRGASAAMNQGADQSQLPTLLGEDWGGLPMGGGVQGWQQLMKIFGAINLPYRTTWLPYVMSAQGLQAVGPPPIDLQSAVERLQGLAPRDGVPPLLDFAERAARASDNPALRKWVDAQATPQQQAELLVRMGNAACHARLSLFYRDDAGPPRVGAELQVLDAGGGVKPWQPLPEKNVAGDDVCAALGEWLQEVFAYVGDHKLELEIELFLPRKLLTSAAYDTATVPLLGGDLRLGEDHPALLRCADRYKIKNGVRLQRLRSNAPAILARLDDPPAQPMRWARKGETAQALRTPFLAVDKAAPVWLGFDPEVCGDESPLDAALSEGLPAVLWLRAPPGAAGLAALEAELHQLLRASAFQLPAKLSAWRKRQTDKAGSTVALLLDDPERLPALMQHAWAQPGG